jgi:hypothetical protein
LRCHASFPTRGSSKKICHLGAPSTPLTVATFAPEKIGFADFGSA